MFKKELDLINWKLEIGYAIETVRPSLKALHLDKKPEYRGVLKVVDISRKIKIKRSNVLIKKHIH